MNTLGAETVGGITLTSGFPAVSADGRFVAFISSATNLDLADLNGRSDVYVHDRQTGETQRASFKTDGSEIGGFIVGVVAINADLTGGVDGQFVVYSINTGNTNVFLYDRVTGTTEKIDVKSDGTDANNDSEQAVISADGRFVAFRSGADNLDSADLNGVFDIYLRDRQAGTTIRVSLNKNGVEANGACSDPAISADGRFVGFQSLADNLDLVSADTNGAHDYFLHDRQTGVTERVSLDENDAEGQGDGASSPMGINEDGRFIVFTSNANNLVPGDSGFADVFVRARCSE